MAMQRAADLVRVGAGPVRCASADDLARCGVRGNTAALSVSRDEEQHNRAVLLLPVKHGYTAATAASSSSGVSSYLSSPICA
jgi:hypothetical protein